MKPDNSSPPVYEHTQTGWVVLIALAAGGVIPLGVLLFAGNGPDAGPARAIVAGVLLLLAASAFLFASLTVTVDEERLRWRFGPGLIRLNVLLVDIVEVEAARTAFWEGWGIHLTRRGWLYNVSGWQAVHVRLRGGRQFLLGTDEPERLIEAIRAAKRF